MARILDAELAGAPHWLLRPGPAECGSRWQIVCSIYCELTGLHLPDAMPPRETRRVDAVLDPGDGQRRILEVDERQHFNRYRALTLRHYPTEAPVAFPIEKWIEQSEKTTRLEGSASPSPRSSQPSTDDTPSASSATCWPIYCRPEHGWKPTLRIGEFEILDWIYASEAEARMGELLTARLAA